MAGQDLVFRFLGVDAGASREFDRMAGKSASLHKAIGALGVGFAAAAVGIGVESVKAAAKFQQSMELIHTQAGASQAEVNKLSKAVLALAGPTATAPDTLTQGLYHLESAGFHGAKAMAALKVAAEGAKIGGANLEDVTNALNATLVSGIKGAQNMSEAMGALNATVGAGDMRMQDLAEALGTGVLASVKGFGLSLNDVGAALATFGDNNIRGADAATQLRMAVLFMAKPAASAKAALKELGLSSSTLAHDMGKGGLGLALTDLHDRLVKAGDTGAKMGQVLVELFGHRAGTGLAILEQQLGRFQQKQEQVRTGSKNFASDWTAYTKTFGYSWDRARSAFQAMVIQLGEKLLPTATRAMNWIGTKGVADLDKFGGWVSRNKRPIEDIAKTLAVIAAFRFTTGKLNDLSRLLGFGGRGALGGAGLLGSAKPVPVYVTNMGAGGFGGKGPGGGPMPIPGGRGGAPEPIPGGGSGIPGIGRGPVSILKSLPLYAVGAQRDLGVGTQNLGHGIKVQSDAPRELKALLAQVGALTSANKEAAKSFAHIGSNVSMDKLREWVKVWSAATKGAHSYSDTLSGPIIKRIEAAEAAHRRAIEAAVIAERKAVDDTIAQLKRIPGAYAQVAAEAKAGGLSIGQALDSGVTIGIQQGQGQIMMVTTQVVDGAIHRAHIVAQAASPSKRMVQLGKWISEGLAIGIGERTSTAVDAARRLVDKVTSKLDTIKGQASGLANGIIGNLNQGASLSNVPTSDSLGSPMAPTVAGVQAYLADYLKREKTFARNLGLLRKRGLSAGEVAQIAQMGLDQGGPIAQALAGASKHQLAQINALDTGIARTSRQIGISASQAVYGKQEAELVRAQKESNELLKLLTELTKKNHVTKLDEKTIEALVHALAKLHIHVSLKEQDRKNGQKILVATL